ncbi:MAG: hypothetical protein C5B51_02860 [Terriglobia bacterium]|nr:MAG: hypothetical protein C5B51_02860 [Terriglobia bacterium]
MAAAAAVLLAALPALAQNRSIAAKPAATASKTWTPPKMSDGVPDLQGVWTNATTTALERPQNLGAREFYTEQEMAQREKDEAAAAAKAEEGRQTEPGTAADVHYDLGQFGLARHQSKSNPNPRTSLIVGPEGRIPPLLPEAQKRQADRLAANRKGQFDGPENRPLSERCIVQGHEGPPMLPAGYNANLQIQQGPGYVAIMHEMVHDTRIIPTDNSTHLAKSVRQFLGDSRGHWEGNTLVVDTTNFTDRTAFRGSSENLHVVERFTRTAEDTILYQFTVEDPSTWAKSWSAELPMTKIDGQIYEYACQEGNYGMRNTLHGAREAEKEEEAAKKGSR